VAAAGAASDYCGAFKEMQAVTKQPSTAVAAAAFRQAAADMKKYAPAEITDSANAYADVLVKVADSIESHQAKATSTLMKELSANPTMIAEVSAYVAKHCTA
jgi:vacuolar-type H+-ATPase catalytic subunit A/Vma1